ncbi:hypothetical protein [Methanogenium cariaci]|uniref:hypothetical protein n=1 Tax=Methanogenium cariaci TaxID=2197 RepID=UPI000785BB42|nr:hypothetical protein [Methanogenium cariaci]
MKSAFADHDKLALLIIGIVLFITLYAFGSLLGVVILAVSLAVVVMPLNTWLARFVSKQVAAFAVTFIVSILAIGALAFGAVILYGNADYLTQIITQIYAALIDMALIPPGGMQRLRRLMWQGFWIPIWTRFSRGGSFRCCPGLPQRYLM